MNPDLLPSTTPFEPPAERSMGTVVAFPGPAARRFRRDEPDAQAAPGRILLFTGVRYERFPDAETASAELRRRWS